jgi:hypothetical protein
MNITRAIYFNYAHACPVLTSPRRYGFLLKCTRNLFGLAYLKTPQDFNKAALAAATVCKSLLKTFDRPDVQQVSM